MKNQKNIDKDIQELEKMESVYNNFSSMYLSILNKNGDRNIINDIMSNIECKKTERENLNSRIVDTFLEINTLKNIIRSDNLDDETPVIDTEINPALLCFTCHEGQSNPLF